MSISLLVNDSDIYHIYVVHCKSGLTPFFKIYIFFINGITFRHILHYKSETSPIIALKSLKSKILNKYLKCFSYTLICIKLVISKFY